jgi:hypothetical protein
MTFEIPELVRTGWARATKHAQLISVLMIVLFGILYWQHDQETKAQAEQARLRALEQNRVNTGDPVQNLGGCMANHATLIAKYSIGEIMYHWSTNQTIPNDTETSYLRVRQMLLNACADYWPAAKATKGLVTDTDINTALYVALKSDPEVLQVLESRRSADQTVRSIYVK